MDTLSKEHRSWNMGRIRSRDTTPELKVRSVLHRLGYRFRLHSKTLPGKPDIVLPKWKLVILVHGCFWHRHTGCKMAYTPKSRIEFWNGKFNANVVRDQAVRKMLTDLGWHVSTVWECQTEDPTQLERAIRNIMLPLEA